MEDRHVSSLFKAAPLKVKWFKSSCNDFIVDAEVSCYLKFDFVVNQVIHAACLFDPNVDICIESHVSIVLTKFDVWLFKRELDF